ncbi:LOW QUALITY PROTEIN: UBN2 domain-containing protein, partial [Cephalotus follicularis]
MTIFIQSIYYQLWNIITNGPEIPTKIVKGQKVNKLDSEYNELDYLLQLNAKAKHVIFCVLSPSEFNKVSYLDSAKEMRDRLMVTYEGTNQVKDTKTNRLLHDYELFTMLENENISSMYARFNDIINALKGLGKIYTNHELVNLLGSLMTHELRMSDQARDDPKKKTITLKASKEEESDEEMSLLTKR